MYRSRPMDAAPLWKMFVTQPMAITGKISWIKNA